MSTTVSHSLSDRFARRTEVFGTSIWTDILRQKEKHVDPVYFGDGAPAKELLPIDRLREANQIAWDDAEAALAYGDQQGYAPLRQWIGDHVAKRGIVADPDTILITGGSTQGLDYACRVFLEEGDAIVVEIPTFLGAIEIFQTYGVELIGVHGDEHGMDIDALQHVLESNPNVKAIYTIPTFQNPSGTTMPLDRRERMVELADAHNVAIFEDDPYGDLQYSGDPVPPIRTLSDNVLFFGTFSKTIAPGIRTGWVIAPPEVSKALLSTREVADISNDRIMMRTVYHAANGFLDDHIARCVEFYRHRRDVMLQELEKHMPEQVTWSKPDGGFFVWITLPENIDSDRMFDVAADHGVIFFPGQWFDPEHEASHTVRLSFSTVPDDRIRLGIERLGQAIRTVL